MKQMNYTPSGYEDDFSSDGFESNSDEYSEINFGKIDDGPDLEKLWMKIPKDYSCDNRHTYISLMETFSNILLKYKIPLNINVINENICCSKENRKSSNDQFIINMIENFLQAIKLPNLSYFFKNMNFRQFLCLTDDQLLKLGIISYVDRREILMGIKILHKTKWISTSLHVPRIKHKKQLSFSVGSALLANLSIQAEMISASLDWMKMQMLPDKNPNLPLIGAGSVVDLYLNLYETNANVICLHQKLLDLQSQINKIKNYKEIESPDYIGTFKKKSMHCYFKYFSITCIFFTMFVVYKLKKY